MDDRFVAVARWLADTTRDLLLVAEHGRCALHEEHALAGAAEFVQRLVELGRPFLPLAAWLRAIMPILSVAAMFSFVASSSFAILGPVSVADADDGGQARRPAFS